MDDILSIVKNKLENSSITIEKINVIQIFVILEFRIDIAH